MERTLGYVILDTISGLFLGISAFIELFCMVSTRYICER